MFCLRSSHVVQSRLWESVIWDDKLLIIAVESFSIYENKLGTIKYLKLKSPARGQFKATQWYKECHTVEQNVYSKYLFNFAGTKWMYVEWHTKNSWKCFTYKTLTQIPELYDIKTNKVWTISKKNIFLTQERRKKTRIERNSSRSES